MERGYLPHRPHEKLKIILKAALQVLVAALIVRAGGLPALVLSLIYCWLNNENIKKGGKSVATTKTAVTKKPRARKYNPSDRLVTEYRELRSEMYALIERIESESPEKYGGGILFITRKLADPEDIVSTSETGDNRRTIFDNNLRYMRNILRPAGKYTPEMKLRNSGTLQFATYESIARTSTLSPKEYLTGSPDREKIREGLDITYSDVISGKAEEKHGVISSGRIERVYGKVKEAHDATESERGWEKEHGIETAKRIQELELKGFEEREFKRFIQSERISQFFINAGIELPKTAEELAQYPVLFAEWEKKWNAEGNRYIDNQRFALEEYEKELSQESKFTFTAGSVRGAERIMEGNEKYIAQHTVGESGISAAMENFMSNYRMTLDTLKGTSVELLSEVLRKRIADLGESESASRLAAMMRYAEGDKNIDITLYWDSDPKAMNVSTVRVKNNMYWLGLDPQKIEAAVNGGETDIGVLAGMTL